MWHTKNAYFREMQFWSHCYTVVSYQALFSLSVYKIPAVYLSGAKNVCFCTIRDFGSPTIMRRKLMSKAQTHYKKENTCRQRIKFHKRLISKALSDGQISEQEFKIILEELDKYNNDLGQS